MRALAILLLMKHLDLGDEYAVLFDQLETTAFSACYDQGCGLV